MKSENRRKIFKSHVEIKITKKKVEEPKEKKEIQDHVLKKRNETSCRTGGKDIQDHVLEKKIKKKRTVAEPKKKKEIQDHVLEKKMGENSCRTEEKERNTRDSIINLQHNYAGLKERRRKGEIEKDRQRKKSVRN